MLLLILERLVEWGSVGCIRKVIDYGQNVDRVRCQCPGLRFGGANDDATRDELEEFLRRSGMNMSYAKLVDTITPMGAVANKNLTRGGKRGKRGFKHVAVRVEDSDEDESEGEDGA